LRRAVVASTVGTTIEWYDFLIYSTMTGLVFGKVFFAGSDPLIDTLKAFGVFFIGFVARPIGAAIFGHYGDRIGRKATLIVTLLMTGIATAAVGLVPGYEIIGIWGAVILTLLRLIQGIGVGGEWGGSVLLAMEWARGNKNRGFIASWPQFGAPAGLFLANLAVLIFSWISGDEFLTWGWRIPFLISIVMVGVGLWIRLGILETPVFRRVLEENRAARAPTIEVFRRQPKTIALTALLRMAEQAPGYIFNAFIFTYGTQVLGASRDLLLTGLIVTTMLGFIWAPIAGALSDKVGRRQMYIIGCHLRGDLHVRVFRDARYEDPVGDIHRRRAVVHPGNDDVRARSGADRRSFPSATALQRRLDRLSAGLDYRRRACALYRDLAIRNLQLDFSDRRLCGRLRGHQHHRDSVIAGLHEQGHLD
jgi:MFS family permease